MKMIRVNRAIHISALLGLMTLSSWATEEAAPAKSNIKSGFVLKLDAPYGKAIGVEGASIKEVDVTFPRNWRTTWDSFPQNSTSNPATPADKASNTLPHISAGISREGMEDLKASGSAEFSERQLQKMKKEILEVHLKNSKNKVPLKKLVVLDLREEPHGIVNGLAVSWYGKDNALNRGKDLAEIEKDEKAKLQELKSQGSAKVFAWDKEKGRTLEIKKVESIMTERELVEKMGMEYVRIPVTDHRRPEDSEVDQFVKLFKTPAPDRWLHLHCAAGRGRTSTFMTLYDMIQNCKKVSMEDIAARQHLIGGLDLFRKDKLDNNDWIEARREFVKEFYKYCKANTPEFRKTWTEWVKASAKQDEKAPIKK